MDFSLDASDSSDDDVAEDGIAPIVGLPSVPTLTPLTISKPSSSAFEVRVRVSYFAFPTLPW